MVLQELLNTRTPTLEIILLTISSVLWYLCLKDPNANLTESDHVPQEQILPFILPLFAQFKYLVALYSLAEIYGSSSGFSVADSNPAFRESMVHDRGMAPSFATTVRFVGLVLFIFGSSLRLWAMRTLGSLFTFNLSIRSSHTLIRTGPYGWVRNPSYTGLYLMQVGMYIVGSTGSVPYYLSLVGAQIGVQIASPGLLLLFAINLLVTHYLIRTRIINEESMLEGEFKEEWKRYTKDTPYRLLPWIW